MTAFDDWASLAELLRRHEPGLLARLDFPAAQSAQLEDYVAAARRLAGSSEEPATRLMVVRTLRRLAPLVPELAGEAYEASARLELGMPEPIAGEKPVRLRPLSAELEHLLAQPLLTRDRDELLVARVLREL